MFHVKRISALVTVALVLSLAVVSAFAAPTANPSTMTEIGGALSREATIDLYHAINAQAAFLASSTASGSLNQLVPFLLTATDNGADMWTYRVYMAPSGASITATGAEWQSPGADLTITGSTYVYECVYDFARSGGMGNQVYKYFGSNALALRDNEWAVWAWNAVPTNGMSSLFQYGFYNDIPAVRDWLNALNAFDGNLTPEIVQDKVEQARAEGYREGEKVGIASGVASADEYWRTEASRLESIAFEKGDREGYERAVKELGAGDNASYNLDIPAIFSAIPASAKSIINSAFGFEVFGINVAGLLSVVLIISVVGFIVGKLSSR